MDVKIILKTIHNKSRWTYSLLVFNFYDISIWWYRNKHDVYKGEYCMKKFYESLREYPAKITNVEKNEIIPLTNEQQELYEKTIIIKIIVKLKTLLLYWYI